MDVGSCKIVFDEEGTAVTSGIKEGQIIFMRSGPINFLPLVNEYDRKLPNGKPVIKGSNMSERVLRQREKNLINAFV